MRKHITVCAGIDTGKYKLDVAIEGSLDQVQIDNMADGHAALSVWLKRHKVTRVGIEASGGYEQNVVARLRHDGFVVVVFHPARVRAYARFLLQKAKNDKIDAALSLHGSDQKDSCAARWTPGAICGATSRCDDRGHAPGSRPLAAPRNDRPRPRLPCARCGGTTRAARLRAPLPFRCCRP